MSDHLPVKLKLFIDMPKLIKHNLSSNNGIKFNWPDSLPQDKLNYKNILKTLLSQIDIPINSVLCCDNHCKLHYEKYIKYQYSIIEAIEFATLGSIPLYKSHISKSKIIKGWNENVESFRKKAMFWHEIWKQCDRPINGVISDIRRHTRTLYHKSIKDNTNLQNNIIKINVASNLMTCNSRLFWREINKITRNENNDGVVPIDGKIGIEACNLFRDKYRELYNKTSQYDIMHKRCCDMIQDNCNNTNNIPNAHLHMVNAIMVKNAVKHLNKGKKDESNLLYSDAIIEAPDELYVHLANLFTIMLRHSYSSEIFNLVIFSPLIKDKRKDSSDSDNYRAIALNSCLSKLLDYIFLDFFKVNLHSSSNQFAYKEKSSTTLCTYMVIETIQYYQSRGTNVIASCLDFSKAFDMVQYSELFNILFDKKICPLVIRLLIQFYSSMIGLVKWYNLKSDIFKIENGVKQGGVLSPVLFTLYIDCLIERILSMKVGCHIGNRNLSILVYADDIILLSPTFKSMNLLLYICESFSNKYGLKFNVKKSEAILFGQFDNVPDLKLNNQRIVIKNKVKYLGNYLTNENNYIDYSSFVKDIKVRGNVISTKFKFLSIESKREIFLSQISCFYGCELLNLQDYIMHELDVAWRISARKVFQIPKRTHSYLLPSLMNCDVPSTNVLIRILKFYFNGIHSKDDLIKFVFENSFYSMTSIMCKNLFFIMFKLLKNVLSIFNEDFILSKYVRKFKKQFKNDWKTDLIYELLKMRDGSLLSNLSLSEVNLLIEEFCTSE